MGAVLIHADSRSPDMRHEVPVMIPDAFLYAETNGRRAVVLSAFEVPRLEAAGIAVEALLPEKLGLDELLAGGTPLDLALLEIYARACEELRRDGGSIYRGALRFVLANPAVTGAIVGVRNEREARDLVAAAA